MLESLPQRRVFGYCVVEIQPEQVHPADFPKTMVSLADIYDVSGFSGIAPC